MKKALAAVIAALALASAIYSAEVYGAKKSKSKKEIVASDEVIMVGSATVKVDDENFDFYAKTWGVKDFDKEDCYFVFGDAYAEYATLFFGSIKKTDNGKYGVYKPGDIFMSKQKIKKGILLSDYPIKWRFYSDPNFEIYLPLYFEATVPKGEKYVYVGHFEYHLEGSDFHATKILVSDRFDQAKESLEREFGEPIQLCRVELREPEKK